MSFRPNDGLFPALECARVSADDFIEVYDAALPPESCAALIAQFESSADLQPGRVGGGVHTELKDSADITISGRPEWREAEALLNQAVFIGLARYLRRYPYALIAPLAIQMQDPATGEPARLTEASLRTMPDEHLFAALKYAFRPGNINLQRYRADHGGYPYWHCELFPQSPNAEQLHRHVLWTIYLNDGFGEGETEFLYQQRKIVPRTGSLLIAPTAFTHTHRGNTPRGGDKYIATSWALFNRAENLFGAS
jgi:hypothetical protein